MIPVVGLGAGGHARVVIDILQLRGEYEIVGLLDADSSKVGSEVAGIKIIGDDSLLTELFEQGVGHAFLGLGSIGKNAHRIDLYERARRVGFSMIAAVHPLSSVSGQASIGHGPTVMAGAVVNAGARIGDNVIINTGAIVEHDCWLGDHVHVATGACLCGTVTVGRAAHIGAGAIVRQNISIGDRAIVGAGSVVVKDVPDNLVVMGVPAKSYKRVDS